MVDGYGGALRLGLEVGAGNVCGRVRSESVAATRSVCLKEQWTEGNEEEPKT